MASNTNRIEQLKRAVELAEQIESLQAELNQIIGGVGSGGLPNASASEAPVVKTRKRRKMSKAARERIAAAQRARWAKQKGQG